MHEKDLGISEYLDLYGDILDEKQRAIAEMYYYEDYSLSEISEITGITRQGVSESVRKSVKRLRDMEDKLHLKSRMEAFESRRNAVVAKAAALSDNISSAKLSEDLTSLADEIEKLSI